MYVNKREQTRNKIIKAFMLLYAENNIDKITVKQISAAAGVNRSTFYVYFIDVYDLLENIENEMLEIIKENLDRIFSSIKAMSFEVFTTVILPLFQKYEDFLPILISKPNSNFKKMFIAVVKNKFFENIPDLSKEEIRSLDLCLIYHFSAIISLFSKWYEDGRQYPIDDLMGLIKDISESGVLTIISSRYLNQSINPE